MGDANLPLGGTAIKPAGWDRTGWEAFRYMIYDGENGTILTRTPLSWLKITVFYLIYYTLLACFWIACLMIFFQTLPSEVDGPKWQRDWGLIGSNPGLGLRPQQRDSLIDSQMFVLKDGDTNIHPSDLNGEGDLNADYAVRVSKFLEAYEKTPAPATGDGEYGFKGYQTFRPREKLGECGLFPFGYVAETDRVSFRKKKVTPCIYFKLNNIWGWEPRPVKCGEYMGDHDEDGPLDECPESLRKHLQSPAAKEAGPDNIWIDCNGRNAADQEALEGRITYYPASRALPLSYFPYLGHRNQREPKGHDLSVGYHAPLVAIQVDPATAGQLVHVECRAYYRGVRHDKKDKLGLVQFELQIINDK